MLPIFLTPSRLVSGCVSATALIVFAFALPIARAPAAEPDKPAAAAVAAGKQLVADSKCEACHARKTGGDGSAMYSRKDRRVTTKAKLLPQVARCNSELNLGLFPDDEAAIAAYLNASFYRFTD
jgi:cytochrome c553